MLTAPYPSPPSRGWTLARITGYLAIATAGLFVLIDPPSSYSHLSTALTILWGSLSLGSGLAMAYGVARQRYRWEWLPGWGASTGVAIYAILSWDQVFRDGLGHAPRALIITATVCIILSRVVQLSLIDMTARRVVEMREVTDD